MMVGRLMLAVCLVCFCVSVAGADPAVVAKVRDLAPMNAGVDDNPNCDGVATLVYNSGTDSTEISIVITGFQAGTQYGVQFLRWDGAALVSDADAIAETNPAGNGHGSISVPGVDLASWAVSMEVFIDADADGVGTGDEILAFGLVE